MIDLNILQMPAFMLGFTYHDEHLEYGLRGIEIFLGLFVLGIYF